MYLSPGEILRHQDRLEDQNEAFWDIVAESDTIQDIEQATNGKAKYSHSDAWSDFFDIDGYVVRVCADCGYHACDEDTECEHCGYSTEIAQGTEDANELKEAA